MNYADKQRREQRRRERLGGPTPYPGGLPWLKPGRKKLRERLKRARRALQGVSEAAAGAASAARAMGAALGTIVPTRPGQAEDRLHRAPVEPVVTYLPVGDASVRPSHAEVPPALPPAPTPLPSGSGRCPPPPRCGEDSAQAHAQGEAMRAANPTPQRLPAGRRVALRGNALALIAALGALHLPPPKDPQ